MAEVKTKKKEHRKGQIGTRGLAIILGVLGVVIVGLVVGIVAAKVSENNGPEEMDGLDPASINRYYEEHDWELTGSELALVISNTILDKLDSDPDYSVEDAKNDFALELLDANDEQTKKNLAYSFSDFVFTQGDTYEAINILTSNEEFFVWDSDKIDYYSKLAQYYEALGDTANVELCSDAINKITSSWDTAPRMNSEGQVYE